MGILRFSSTNGVLDRYANGNADLGVTNAAAVPVTGAGMGGVLNATAGTLEVSDNGVTWRAMLRGDTGAAITALSASNIPVALNARYMRCTAGSATIRPMITS